MGCSASSPTGIAPATGKGSRTTSSHSHTRRTDASPDSRGRSDQRRGSRSSPAQDDEAFGPLAPDAYAQGRLFSFEREMEDVDRKLRGEKGDEPTTHAGDAHRANRRGSATLVVATDTRRIGSPPGTSAAPRGTSPAGARVSGSGSHADYATPPSGVLASPQVHASVTGAAVLEELRSGGLSAQEIQQVYASTMALQRSPEFYVTVGELLIQKSEPLMAEDILYNGSKQYPSSLRLRQLHCRALAQGGSAEKAITLLEGLRSEMGASFDEESGGLLARCYKDLAGRQKSPEQRAEYLSKAHAIYKELYDNSGRTSYYTGINTATMALLLGNEEEASQVAAQVVRICEEERAGWPAELPKGAYWALATLGEASLIAGHLRNCLFYYSLAVSIANNDYMKLSSTKRQLQLLLDHVDIPDADLAALEREAALSPSNTLSAPAIAVKAKSATAFMMPAAVRIKIRELRAAMQRRRHEARKRGRKSTRARAPGQADAELGALRMALFDTIFDLPRVAVFITAEIHDGVVAAPGAQAVMAAQFDIVLDKVKAHFGYACPTTVADIVFLEAVKRCGGDIYIVLPVPLDVHLKACAPRFAEFEALTGEACGPFGARYVELYKHDTFIADAAKSAQGGVRGGHARARSSMMFDEYGVLRTAQKHRASVEEGSATEKADDAPAAHSDDPLPKSNLLARMRALLGSAARVDISNDMSPETSITNRHYCSLILNGLAVMRARTLCTAVERIYLTPNVMKRGETIGQRPGDEILAEPEAEAHDVSALPDAAAQAPPALQPIALPAEVSRPMATSDVVAPVARKDAAGAATGPAAASATVPRRLPPLAGGPSPAPTGAAVNGSASHADASVTNASKRSARTSNTTGLPPTVPQPSEDDASKSSARRRGAGRSTGGQFLLGAYGAPGGSHLLSYKSSDEERPKSTAPPSLESFSGDAGRDRTANSVPGEVQRVLEVVASEMSKMTGETVSVSMPQRGTAVIARPSPHQEGSSTPSKGDADKPLHTDGDADDALSKRAKNLNRATSFRVVPMLDTAMRPAGGTSSRGSRQERDPSWFGVSSRGSDGDSSNRSPVKEGKSSQRSGRRTAGATVAEDSHDSSSGNQSTAASVASAPPAAPTGSARRVLDAGAPPISARVTAGDKLSPAAPPRAVDRPDAASGAKPAPSADAVAVMYGTVVSPIPTALPAPSAAPAVSKLPLMASNTVSQSQVAVSDSLPSESPVPPQELAQAAPTTPKADVRRKSLEAAMMGVVATARTKRRSDARRSSVSDAATAAAAASGANPWKVLTQPIRREDEEGFNLGLLSSRRGEADAGLRVGRGSAEGLSSGNSSETARASTAARLSVTGAAGGPSHRQGDVVLAGRSPRSPQSASGATVQMPGSPGMPATRSRTLSAANSSHTQGSSNEPRSSTPPLPAAAALPGSPVRVEEHYDNGMVSVTGRPRTQRDLRVNPEAVPAAVEEDDADAFGSKRRSKRGVAPMPSPNVYNFSRLGSPIGISKQRLFDGASSDGMFPSASAGSLSGVAGVIASASLPSLHAEEEGDKARSLLPKQRRRSSDAYRSEGPYPISPGIADSPDAAPRRGRRRSSKGDDAEAAKHAAAESAKSDGQAAAPGTAAVQSQDEPDSDASDETESWEERPRSPDMMLSPEAAAVFSGIPSAVEQWVAQQFSFRVLFMDSQLASRVASLFENSSELQLLERDHVTQVSVAPAVSPAAPSLVKPRGALRYEPIPEHMPLPGQRQSPPPFEGPRLLREHDETSQAQGAASQDGMPARPFKSQSTATASQTGHGGHDASSLSLIPALAGGSDAGPDATGRSLATGRSEIEDGAATGRSDASGRDSMTGENLDDVVSWVVRQAQTKEGIPGARAFNEGKEVPKWGLTVRALFALRRAARRHRERARHGPRGPGSMSRGESVDPEDSSPAVLPPRASQVAALTVAGTPTVAQGPLSPQPASKGPEAVSDAAPASNGVEIVHEEKQRMEVMAQKQVIMAILFADIVGYSKMGEMQVLTFVERFLGSVAALIEALPPAKQPKVRNTWGDACYFVFSRVPDAGAFALLFSDLVTRVPWWKLGLPKSLNIRISLHAAPVHPVIDPITQTKNYTGVHTSRAARIEPITPPGCVYCSQAFAAMSETLCVNDYECTYVGNVPLAKGYGLQPVYHVRWSPSSHRMQQFLTKRAGILPFIPTSPHDSVLPKAIEDGEH